MSEKADQDKIVCLLLEIEPILSAARIGPVKYGLFKLRQNNNRVSIL